MKGYICENVSGTQNPQDIALEGRLKWGLFSEGFFCPMPNIRTVADKDETFPLNTTRRRKTSLYIINDPCLKSFSDTLPKVRIYSRAREFVQCVLSNNNVSVILTSNEPK